MEESASSNDEEEEPFKCSKSKSRGPNKPSDIFKGIKMKIPKFKGTSNPEAYLEWESKIEMVFACQNYTEEEKVKLAVIEFTEYAIAWWDQLRLSRTKGIDEDMLCTRTLL